MSSPDRSAAAPDPDAQAPLDGPAPETKPAPTIWEQMGGPMGMLDSGLPVVVFVLVNAIWHHLGWAIGSALAAGAAIAVARLVRRKPVTQAVAGLFGVGIAAFIAYRTGSAKGYFLFGIWSFVLYGSVLLLSILVRWPLIGVLWESINGRGTAWRKDRKLVRRYDGATAVWVVVFAARFAVQNQLYRADQVGWLATARLLMGYPVYLLAIVVTVLIVGSANGMSLPSLATVMGRKAPADPTAVEPE
ncbi:Protein of unknown function [Nakamurella panacisegetis]|uniref:Intracellular septation protein A n=1 Tax=Nakamurella panacisegetis TaxID=1090615 RepID=A0A1H0QG80_9ACTN|nr:DUF3159 domain-containing protein [Nakamurella panacisegetis]SDP16381.1 Protein of unknown function [Nakamurella panacisegetis]